MSVLKEAQEKDVEKRVVLESQHAVQNAKKVSDFINVENYNVVRMQQHERLVAYKNLMEKSN